SLRNCGFAPSTSSCCGPEATIELSRVTKMYEDTDVNILPSEVTDISLGCGDPVTLAALQEGQTVLDLGSGGGIDCFLAAKKVGKTGKVIGVDMTSAMIKRANTNKAKLGADNVEFRLGQIEKIPVEDNTVDVIISNCVINLSPDKPAVFREAYRVLNPGGKLAVSDIVTEGELPESVKSSLSAWAGCVAGALDVKDYVEAIEDAGFENVDVRAVYWDPEMIEAAIEELELGEITQLQEDNYQKSIFSAKITAWKPT
ncbi:MAG: arsenite methyltransferase, partial [Anaerolineales bacterium]|nr:arsenite methyltransferase [Anaerolineales bacterium]